MSIILYFTHTILEGAIIFCILTVLTFVSAIADDGKQKPLALLAAAILTTLSRLGLNENNNEAQEGLENADHAQNETLDIAEAPI